jgi:hypothetical protein
MPDDEFYKVRIEPRRFALSEERTLDRTFQAFPNKFGLHIDTFFEILNKARGERLENDDTRVATKRKIWSDIGDAALEYMKYQSVIAVERDTPERNKRLAAIQKAAEKARVLVENCIHADHDLGVACQLAMGMLNVEVPLGDGPDDDREHQEAHHCGMEALEQVVAWLAALEAAAAKAKQACFKHGQIAAIPEAIVVSLAAIYREFTSKVPRTGADNDFCKFVSTFLDAVGHRKGGHTVAAISPGLANCPSIETQNCRPLELRLFFFNSFP